MPTTPFATSCLARFIDKRIGELHQKTQADIAKEAGFKNANFITMLKTGSSKLALDRVPLLAKALEVDPALLMRLAIEQSYGIEMLQMLVRLLSAPVFDDELEWLSTIGDASGGSVTEPTARTETAMREVLKHEV